MKLGPGEKTVLLLAGFVIVIAGLRYAEPLLMPLSLAIVIATLSTPIIRWLQKKRVPQVLAILLAVLLDLSVIGGVITLVGSSLNGFTAALPRYQTGLSVAASDSIRWLDAHGLHLSNEVNARVTGLSAVWDLVGVLLRSLMNVVSSSLLVLLLVVFILFEIGRWRLKLGYAMGDPHADMRKFSKVASELQKYLLVKTGMNLITGILCGAWAAVLGVDFPVLWGLIAFLLNYIPTIGSIIAGVPVMLLAWLQFGPASAVVAISGYAVINVALGSVVEPRIMGRALGLSPLVVFVSMVFWFWLWGPIGALLSAPLTMGIKIALAQTADLRWVAIMLGSAHWVEEMHREWTRVRPTLSLHPGDSCVQPAETGEPVASTDETVNPSTTPRTSLAPERFVRINDPSYSKSE
jgi:predicted PurR-regulated permease PerM